MQLTLSQVLEGSIRHAICTSDVILCIPRVRRLYYNTTDPPPKDNETSSYPPSVDLPRWLFSNLCICGEAPDTDAKDNTSFCAASIPGGDARLASYAHNTNAPLHRRRGRMMTVQEVLDIFDALCRQSHCPSHRSFIINVNSLKGAPLTLACAFGATRIVHFLLAHGADPSLRGGVAVQAAIRRRGLTLVRTLVERSPQGRFTCSACEDPDFSSVPGHDVDSVSHGVGDGTGGRDNKNVRTFPRSQSAKRRRLLDRIEITPDLVNEAIRVNARDIVNYFVIEKGCSPLLQTLGKTFFQ